MNYWVNHLKLYINNMRDAAKILDSELEKLNPNSFIQVFYKINRSEILDIIKAIQNDAYNQAIDDALENAAIHQKYYNEYDHRKMYIKWRNKGFPRIDGDGYQYGVDVVSIDKDSILKFKKK